MDKGGSGVGALCPGGGDREEGRCACGRPLDMVDVHVTPTTGGQFQLRVAASDTVEYLRRMVSKRLRVPKERICLLYRDRHLRAGTLQENYIVDGARITLLPSVETGLLTQRPEQSVMQALESLNDGQVNDFLTGKAPLNLTIRLGDHMMLIQLQLSTVSPTSSRKTSSRLSSNFSHHHHHRHHHSHSSSCTPQSTSYSPSSSSPPSSPSPNSSNHHHYHHHHMPSPPHSFFTAPSHHLHHHHHHHSRPSTSSSPNSSPTSSCLPLDGGDLPIRGCPHQAEGSDPKASLDTKALAEASRNLTQTLKQLSSEVLTTKPADKECTKSSAATVTAAPTAAGAGGSERRDAADRASAAAGTTRSSKRRGAIIESMHHHGKGYYSGTFSGTLNPALQDRQGRPKRDISTIIHILNDLLCATPQYRRHSTSSNTSSSSLPSSAHSQTAGICHGNKAASGASNLEPGSQMYGLASRIGTASDEETSVDENQLTRTKLEHLRFIMEQRRARRKARREARSSPYASHQSSGTTSWSSEATTLVTSKASAGGSARGEGGPQGLEVEGKEKEGTDSAALCELNTGTVVA